MPAELEDDEFADESEPAELEEPPDESGILEFEESLDPPSPPDTFFLSLVLKSVSYQPLPFNRKAAAETNLVSFGALHSGQTFKGSSDIF